MCIRDRDRDIALNDLNDILQKKPELQTRSFKVARQCVLFPETQCDATITELNGASVMERRQHPFWRVDVDLDGDGKPDHSFRIRYARDAHKIVRATKHQLELKLMAMRKPRKGKARQPKLRVKRQKPTARGELIETGYPGTPSSEYRTQRTSKRKILRKAKRYDDRPATSMKGIRG